MKQLIIFFLISITIGCANWPTEDDSLNNSQTEKEQSTSDSEVIIGSKYINTTTFNKNTKLYNVVGSSGDKPSGFNPNPGSWIQAYYDKCKTNTPQGQYYSVSKKDCGTKMHIVGGHVVTNAANVKAVPGDTVFIVPICKSENSNTAPIIVAYNKVCAIELYYR